MAPKRNHEARKAVSYLRSLRHMLSTPSLTPNMKLWRVFERMAAQGRSGLIVFHDHGVVGVLCKPA